MEQKKKYIVTVSLLVSNRIDTIRKCMESIQPLLKAIPSELIVVDTVGEKNSDGSLKIAAEYATKVVHFDWCNDFAAARNAGLKEARGEWFLFLDDDEWFEDVSEIIEFFVSGEYKKYNSATYQIHDYRDREGHYVLASLSRMVKLDKDTTFVGAVHECLAPLYLPCKALKSYIHHYGYVFDTEEEKQEHSRRNLSILLPMYEKNRMDMGIRMQLVQEYMYLPELEADGLRLCEDTMQMEEQYYKMPEFQWILAAKIRMLSRGNKQSAVVESIQEIRKKFPLNRICQLALLIMEAEAQREDYEKVLLLAEPFMKLYQEYMANPETYERELVLDFRVFLQDDTIEKTIRRFILAANKAKETKTAKKYVMARTKLLQKPVLTMSLLVSNRIDTIRNCMESLRPLLEQIPSELIIVDTVGEENSDGSLAIAKEYATKTIHFDWCDDFAAARNAGLKEANGEWFLFLDDDEWFEDVSEMVEFFQSGEYLEYASGTYQIRNYNDFTGTSYSTAVLGRMIKLQPDIVFVGRVHETFSERKRPCRDFCSFVHHYGYAYKNEEEKEAHRKRNEALLIKELEKNPLDMRCRAQFAMELASYDNERALDFCEETFELCRDRNTTNEFQWMLSLVFRLYEALGKSVVEAEEKYKELQLQYGYSETAENAACYQMVRICIIQDEPERAYPYAVNYFQTLQLLYENEVLRQEQMTADFMRYQDEKAYMEMLHFGAYCAWQAKQYGVAWNWYESMPWEDVAFQNEEAFSFMVQLFLDTRETERMLALVKRIMKNQALIGIPNVKAGISFVLNEMKKPSPEPATPESPFLKSDIKLSIGVLVSNNLETIERCMESLKPLLAAVPSELIVVDTKGAETDGSFEIARRYADKTAAFTWCDDFAAARNICLDLAVGEWFLFVDDDEWFEDVQELINFFQSGECNRYGYGLYHVRNYTTENQYSMAVVGRLIRRTPSTRFVGKVHEQYNEVHEPFKQFSVVANHTGYLYRNAEEKREHQNRNLSILKEELKTKGYTPHICARIVQELLHVEETREEGYRFCVESLEVLTKNRNQLSDSDMQWLLVASARYYSMAGEQQKLMERICELRENYELSQMARLFLAVLETGVAMEQTNLVQVAAAVEEYLSSRDWLTEHPEDAILQNQLDFGMYFNEATYFKILHIGAMCANAMQKYSLANVYWKRFPWKRNDFDKSVYQQDMKETLEGLKKML